MSRVGFRDQEGGKRVKRGIGRAHLTRFPLPLPTQLAIAINDGLYNRNGLQSDRELIQSLIVVVVVGCLIRHGDIEKE